MRPQDMIPYVESLASQQVPPPYHMPDVTVQGFVWDAQMGPIQAYCDRNYNLGAAKDRGFVYRPAPIWPYVLMLCIDYPVMISCEPESRRGRGTEKSPEPGQGGKPGPGVAPQRLHGPLVEYANRGIVSQREVFVAIPIVRYGTTPLGALTNTTLEWALPFIVVENPMSAICGREMLGLEKLLANVRFGEGTAPGSFGGAVDLPGWVAQGSPQNEALPFLRVTTGPTLPTSRGQPNGTSVWSLLQSRGAREWIRGLSTATDFLESLSEGLAPTTMRTVALKQIRDADAAQRALYQAIVGCRTNYSNIEQFRFYNEQDVTITFRDHKSFKQILDLVLPPPPQGSAKKVLSFNPRAAYTFRADIDFDDMKTLHTFDVVKHPGDPPTEKVGELTAPWARPWKGLFSREAKP